ncbi:MAG: DUF488 family protein [Planctomycetaceae bacterium]
MPRLNFFTIGFTKKSAERFFALLREAGVCRVADVRLHNVSQLAGFAQTGRFVILLREIAGIDYIHLPDLAPTQDMLDAYKKHKGDWTAYETQFVPLMEARHIEQTVAPELRDGDCLLCSEHEPDQCHCRLVIEYLQRAGWDIIAHHLR